MTVAALDAHTEYVLRLGDDALVLAQRLAAWAGHAPIVEEDLALSNVALDLFGQARLWLSYAGEREGKGRDEDALAYFRDHPQFHNLLLVEQPNGDFAHTMARQLLFDVRYKLLLRALGSSNDERISGIAQKSLKEVAYHCTRSRDWAIRLGDGTNESRTRMQRAIDALWAYTGEMFTGDAVDAAAVAGGYGVDPAALADAWQVEISEILTQATLTVPAGGYMHVGGRNGKHTEHLSYLLAEMQSLRRSVPGAVW